METTSELAFGVTRAASSPMPSVKEVAERSTRVRPSTAAITVLAGLLVLLSNTPDYWSIAAIALGAVVTGRMIMSAGRVDRSSLLSAGEIPLGLVLVSTVLPLVMVLRFDADVFFLTPAAAELAVPRVSIFLAGYIFVCHLPRILPRRSRNHDTSLFRVPTKIEIGLLGVAIVVAVTYAVATAGTAYGEGQVVRSALSSANVLAQTWLLIGAVRVAPLMLTESPQRWHRRLRLAALIVLMGGAAVGVTGSRRIPLIIALIFLLSAVFRWPDTPRAVRPRRLVIHTTATLLIGTILWGASSALVAYRGGEAVEAPSLRQMSIDVAELSTASAWIVSETHTMREIGDGRSIRMIAADAAVSMPPPLDSLLQPLVGSDSGIFEFRDAIGFDNPDSGIGLSVIAEVVWIYGDVGALLLGIGMALFLRSLHLRAGPTGMTGLGILVICQIVYLMRSDFVVIFSLLLHWQLWTWASRLGDRRTRETARA